MYIPKEVELEDADSDDCSKVYDVIDKECERKDWYEFSNESSSSLSELS